MGDRNELAVRSVLDDAMSKRASLPAQNTTRKLGTFYATCMDSAAAERDGMSAVKPILASIDSIKTRPALIATIATHADGRGGRRRSPISRRSTCTTPRTTSPASTPAASACPTATTTPRPTSPPTRLRNFYVDHITKLLTLVRRRRGQGPRRRAQDPRARNRAGESVAHARRASRSRRDRSRDDDGEVPRDLAERRLGVVLEGRRRHRLRRQGERRRARVLQAARRSRHEHAARRLEGVSALPRALELGVVAQQAVRRRKLQVQLATSAARRSCCRDGSGAPARPTRSSARRWARPTSPRRSRRKLALAPRP